MSIDLLKFCCEDTGRYNLRQPWRIGDCGYATDGAIIVRLDDWNAYEGAYDNADSHPKNPEQVFALRTADEWSPWPESPPVKPCAQCDGSGKSSVVCEHCRQAKPCESCRGEGVSLRHPTLQVGGKHVANRYARLIAELPNVHWTTDNDENSPVFFRFDGGEGAVMAVDI